MRALSVQGLEVYQEAFRLQQVVFRSTQAWPGEERYSLTDQIRRSSRSIGANLSEAWAKRTYPAHFRSKLTDADGELAETRHWLATATACGYLRAEEAAVLSALADHVGRLLGVMLRKHGEFG
jgi:four helix bundle protein